MIEAALAGVLRAGAAGPVVSTVKERKALNGPATLLMLIARTRQ
jgi:hypothetical protein